MGVNGSKVRVAMPARLGLNALFFLLLVALLVLGFTALAEAKGPPADRPPHDSAGPPFDPPKGPPISPPQGPPISPPVGPPLSPPVGPPLSPPVGPPISPPVGPPFTPPGHLGNGIGSFLGGDGAAVRTGAAFVLLMGLATAGYARSASVELTANEHRRGRHLKRRR
jgi:hypothetical protein